MESTITFFLLVGCSSPRPRGARGCEKSPWLDFNMWGDAAVLHLLSVCFALFYDRIATAYSIYSRKHPTTSREPV